MVRQGPVGEHFHICYVLTWMLLPFLLADGERLPVQIPLRMMTVSGLLLRDFP